MTKKSFADNFFEISILFTLYLGVQLVESSYVKLGSSWNNPGKLVEGKQSSNAYLSLK